MDKMARIRGRDLGEYIWRLWLKGSGRIWRRSERYVHSPFLSLILPYVTLGLDADDRLIPHWDLVECNCSLILYQLVSLAYMVRDYTDQQVPRCMNMESMIKMAWMRLA